MLQNEHKAYLPPKHSSCKFKNILLNIMLMQAYF